MSEERCELGDLPKSMCAHCKGVDLPKETDGLLIKQFLKARYDGLCFVDPSHKIVQDDDIGMLVYREAKVGYACTACVRAIKGTIE